jgi:hypothetical protein
MLKIVPFFDLEVMFLTPKRAVKEVGIIIQLNCAQIVPVKVKYFQTVPNETKNTMKN